MPSWNTNETETNNKLTENNLSAATPKDYEDLLLAYEKLRTKYEQSAEHMSLLVSHLKTLQTSIETSDQNGKEQLAYHRRQEQKRVEQFQALLTENEQWKQQTAVDLKDYSPEKMEQKLDKIVHQHLGNYQEKLDAVLQQADQQAKKERRTDWIERISILGIGAVTLLAIYGMFSFFMGM